MKEFPRKKTKLSTHKKGGLRELNLCAFLIEKGFEVFRNTTPDGMIDIIAVDIDTMCTHYIDSKSPIFSQKDGSLTNRISILDTDQINRGIKAMIYNDNKVFYLDKYNEELKEFVDEAT